LPADGAIQGLCPQCLLSLALDGSDLSRGLDELPTLDGAGRGRILGERYQMRELLGRGGMGEVWRAFDLKLRVDVALKAIVPERAESERARDMLRQEVRSAREVVSPNVCRIFDLVVEEGHELVSMEYIDGTTLADTLRVRGPLQLQEAREIASQFLSGLEAIHQAGLVHRDFKPENVMLTRAGRVVVMDFGLAKGRAEVGTGTVSGTPAYMSPEQARGESVDARADVFSAAVVLTEMLSVGGEGIRARQALWHAVRESPPQVVDGPWASVLRQALDPQAERRHASARVLARALEDVTLRLPGFEEKRPYPGLAAFTQEDAEYFFGREVEVEAIWKKLKRPRLLALIGPSGAGKSSFLRAGLLPTLPNSWKAVITTPGSRPFQALAQALVPVFSGDTEATQALLRFEDPDTAVSLLHRFRQRHEHALVIVDQFEELFTLSPPEVQEAFAKLLGRLVLEADLHVILSLRDDFLFRCHEHEALVPAFSDLTPLGTLGESALRRALVQPALSCGYRFEDETLVDEMLAEVQKERGALPLLAFAASRLWEKRDREQGLLTREAYQEIGGVAGALAQHAEATLERIGAQRTPLVRELFRNLITSQGTRAVRERGELLSVFGGEKERAVAGEVLSTLVDARLLTSYERAGEGGESHHQVEIIHESLLSAWPRLVRWQTQDADGAQLRDQLRQAAQLWHDRGQAEDLLWSGTAYRDFALWKERYPGGLSATEEAFAEAAARRAGRRRRQRRIAVVAVVATLSLGLGVVATLWSRAEISRQKAEEETLRAEASKLLALAEVRLQEDPTEALAFTIASLDEADTAEGRAFAIKALWEAPPAFDLTGGSTMPAFSPDGKWLAAAGFGTDAFVWSEDGRGPLVLSGHEPSLSVARWASKDLLVTGSAGMIGSRAHLWSLPEGRRVRTIDFGRPSYWQVGPRLLLAETLESGSAEQPGAGLLRSWALPDGEPVVLGRIDWRKLGTQVTFFSPDGRIWLYARDRTLYSRPLPVGTGPDRLFARLGAELVGFEIRASTERLVVADKSGETQVWSFPREGPIREKSIPKPDTAPAGMLPDPSDRWLSGHPSADRQVRLWDLSRWKAARPLSLRRSGSWYAAATSFHPRGEWVAASTARTTRLTFWPLSRSYPSVVDGYRAGMRPVAFSSDGKWLATGLGWGDERLRLWPLPGSGVSEVRSLHLPGARLAVRSLAFDPKNRYLFAVGVTGAWVVPLDGSAPRKLPGFSEDSVPNAAGVSPSGRLVATAFFYGRGEKELRVWNLQTGELRRFDLPAGQGGATGAGEAPTGYERGIASLAFVDESTLYTAGDGGLRRWNLETGSHEAVAETSPGYAMYGSFSVGRPVVLTTERRLGHQAEDCPRGALVRDLAAGTSRPFAGFGECGTWSQWAGALDPSGTVAATGSRDGIVRVGRLSGGEPHLLLGHKGVVNNIAISPDLRWLATTGEDDTLRLWPMPDLSKPPLHALPHDPLLAKLRSLTNLRVVRDPSAATGWKVEIGPFPGWKNVPTW
jgi:WD40 repeat protein